MAEHWMERADYVTDGSRAIIGEDDGGYLLVPSRTDPDLWDRRFNPRNPLHWRFWIRSRMTGRIAFLTAPAPSDPEASR